METALLKSKSKADLVLLLKLAAKLHIEGKILTEEEIEDAGMYHAIKKARTGNIFDKRQIYQQVAGEMIVRIDKSFEKDVRKIRDGDLLNELAQCILELQDVEDIRKIKDLKKLQGSKSFYRIRLNDYRIGVCIDGDFIDLIRFLHRKDIYKYFP